MMGFTTSQVKTLTGLTTRQINYFDQTGLLHPSLQQAHGKGTVRYYSFRDLIALKTIAVLRQNGGISLQTIRRAVEQIQHIEGRLLSEVVFTVMGDDVVEVVEKGDPVSLARSLVRNPGQLLYMFIDIATITQEVQHAVSNVG